MILVGVFFIISDLIITVCLCTYSHFLTSVHITKKEKHHIKIILSGGDFLQTFNTCDSCQMLLLYIVFDLFQASLVNYVSRLRNRGIIRRLNVILKEIEFLRNSSIWFLISLWRIKGLFFPSPRSVKKVLIFYVN